MKYTDADMAFLQDLRDTSVYELARMASCGSPSSRTSPGAEFLGEIRDAVVERWEAGRFDWDSSNSDDDLIDECADEGVITDYSHEMAQLFVDLGAYSEASEHTMHGDWSGSLEDIMRDAIAQIAYRISVACINQAREDFAHKFQCSECGDMGAPHICFPGQCNGTEEDKATWVAGKAAEVNAEAVLTTQVPIDPILTLIAQREAETVQGASVTQTFMTNMARINAEEFGTPMSSARRVVLYALGALAMLGVIAVGMVIFG